MIEKEEFYRDGVLYTRLMVDYKGEKYCAEYLGNSEEQYQRALLNIEFFADKE